MRKLFVKSVEHNLEEAFLDGKRTIFQLGPFVLVGNPFSLNDFSE